MTERQTTTSDIGHAIREFCEGCYVAHVNGETWHGNADIIKFVDVSDPDMPVLHMQNGAVFTVHLLRAL